MSDSVENTVDLLSGTTKRRREAVRLDEKVPQSKNYVREKRLTQALTQYFS